ncbi:helix-turn-helix transcriptional regulator [Rosenbergiella nectarea]|uniref:helix-turn-helix transcriptional regulator n=1 Tax=Rosenbergiella nectarea TaxID=988801 RepID=UPI001F4E73EA|nr:hypothetical protein [Rosenbergiella nectarea]
MHIESGALVTMNFIEANTGYKKTYIYEQISKGNLAPAIKRGRKSLWRVEDVQQFQRFLLETASHH